MGVSEDPSVACGTGRSVWRQEGGGKTSASGRGLEPGAPASLWVHAGRIGDRGGEQAVGWVLDAGVRGAGGAHGVIELRAVDSARSGRRRRERVDAFWGHVSSSADRSPSGIPVGIQASLATSRLGSLRCATTIWRRIRWEFVAHQTAIKSHFAASSRRRDPPVPGWREAERASSQRPEFCERTHPRWSMPTAGEWIRVSAYNFEIVRACRVNSDPVGHGARA
jgi:hypothetical protein